MNKMIIKINNEEYTIYRTTNDFYGNPRYVIHFLTLGLDVYISLSGIIKKYRGKNFGGGYVFQSYEPKETLKYILKKLEKGGYINGYWL